MGITIYKGKPRSLRHLWKRYLQRKARRAACHMEQAELLLPAVVFAPHMDDETLGVGGTLALKRQLGARVKVVFLTDGSSSHSRLMPREELIELRKREAVDALGQLGIGAEDILFLDADDRHLDRDREWVLPMVRRVLEQEKPRQVFMPFVHDPTSDHQAAAQIVLEALKESNLAVSVYEYPVWFWNHWPWVELPTTLKRKSLKVMQDTFKFGFGLRVVEFDCAVDVTAVLHTKQTALEHYRSQMEALIPDVNWPRLRDVSNGEWLDNFFLETEFFRCWQTKDGK